MILGRATARSRGSSRASRLDSHRLIEEFMIAANVAAAETLERAAQPCMYRVHDAPDPQDRGAARVPRGHPRDSPWRAAR